MYLVLIANFLLIQSIHSANHGVGWYHVGAGVGDDIRGHHMRDVLELMEDVKNFQYDEQAVVEEGASQSGQYARFQQGSEYSLEVTWKRQLTESISLQPSFQYIKNDNGDFTALSARLYVNF